MSRVCLDLHQGMEWLIKLTAKLDYSLVNWCWLHSGTVQAHPRLLTTSYGQPVQMNDWATNCIDFHAEPQTSSASWKWGISERLLHPPPPHLHPPLVATSKPSRHSSADQSHQLDHWASEATGSLSSYSCPSSPHSCFVSLSHTMFLFISDLQTAQLGTELCCNLERACTIQPFRRPAGNLLALINKL